MLILVTLLGFYIGAIFGNIYFNLKENLIKTIEKEEDKKTKKKNKKTKNTKKGILYNIPIFSYIFAYNKEEKKLVKPKLYSEIITGIIFALLLIIDQKNGVNEVLLISFPLMFGFIYLLGEIEREKHIIEPNVITFGVMVAAIEISLKFVINFSGSIYTKANIIAAGFYMGIVLLMFVIQMATASKDPESKYLLDIVMILFILTIFFGSIFMLKSIVCIIIYILLGHFLGVFSNKEYKENILVKKENAKVKTRKESAFVKEGVYIPYAEIIGYVTIVYLLVELTLPQIMR